MKKNGIRVPGIGHRCNICGIKRKWLRKRREERMKWCRGSIPLTSTRGYMARIEARGFIFGPPIALAIGAKFVSLRKPKKLPDLGGANGNTSVRASGFKSEKVHLIEIQRAYNCEIMLTKVKVPLSDLMRLRTRGLKAVMRQDVGYFDLQCVLN